MLGTRIITSLAFLLAGTAFAQNTTSSSVIRIEVGNNGGLKFNPPSVRAVPGTKIEFDFYPMNHSVVQSDFNSPCHPSERAIYSGFIPSRSGPANTSFILTINDTRPIWYYCSQGRHCQQGMVGVINPPNSTDETLERYIANSAKATRNDSPAGGVEGGSNAPNGSAVASASSASSMSAASATGGSGGSGGSPTGTATGAAATTTRNSAARTSEGRGQSGVLIGLVVGLAAMLV